MWTLCLKTFHRTHICLWSVHIYPRNIIVAMTYAPTHVYSTIGIDSISNSKYYTTYCLVQLLSWYLWIWKCQQPCLWCHYQVKYDLLDTLTYFITFCTWWWRNLHMTIYRIGFERNCLNINHSVGLYYKVSSDIITEMLNKQKMSVLCNK